ncbi:FG-GAP-like repeat-containing protein [Mucilaginibacter glaciei]|uniref:VCBS repeat-containing protein n=1 Tax=Mucilaginibacter glaciei TaxID=2772109 RepID=A0A926S3N2_9SPHI|nr:FG-GAP-like repeat-containing protein [Mucilaginibacter glaciei]MBD1394419.1 VCBS repeat-containing protein [Mucilaginibacter glaciei]
MRALRFPILIAIALFAFSCKKATLFEKVASSHSNIKFNNNIVENDSINPLDMLNIYNGGGVGVGDFNNDGLQDLYFVGNAVSNKLYINKGDMVFDDVTDKAGVGGKGGWGRGVAVFDINNDGFKDIYVCNTLLNNPVKRVNLLYINLGPDKDGVPHFKEQAAAYGLDINVHSTMASFFDYDNDGDLDMYLTVNEAKSTDNTSAFRPIITDGSARSTGRLYRNDYNAALKHAVYTNVSKQAGILIEGYGHATSIADINRDGWKDIYVTNDFLPSNILYINNHDGTFTDRTREYFKHTATSAMGQDIQDINNDGLADVFELDMDPEDNYRKKMFMPGTQYQLYQNFDNYGYQYQYNHNTLQLNQGPRLGQNDSIGAPVFSEIAFLSGVAQTDWSWGPMITDFDNDGFRDIVVTNGYPRDVTDHDFITFREESYAVATKKQVLDQIPVVKIPNYAFRNTGTLQFEDVSKKWGVDEPSFSNGATYADLDNDGAMDMIINNINSEASIYRNTLRENNKDDSHYLHIQFKGDEQNKDGIGAWADIYYNNGKHQVYENSPFRGYLSTIQNIANFGLGKVTRIDSVVIKWQNGKQQKLQNVKVDQTLTVTIADAKIGYSFDAPKINTQSLFTEVTKNAGINYIHKSDDFIDFNIQKLIPHKLSEYSPAIAVGDINGDGFDDMVVGGTSKYPAQLFLQQASGKFIQREMLATVPSGGTKFKDEGLLLFDADGDGDLDLYVASGGYEQEPGSISYQDRVYMNNGKGDFTLQPDALPANFTSKLCVKAVDYDKNGKLDLFVSGRVQPWEYPKPVSSLILRNDSKPGQIKFTDVTPTVAKGLTNIGLVCDAAFTDYDNDGWPDLVITGEWMPVKFFKNDHGIFKDQTEGTGIANQLGWWNTITGADFDHDGDIDYIVGNTGLNTFYKATDQYPMYITAKDFDNNHSYDAFPSVFLKDKKGVMQEFPAHTREDIVKQMISMRIKFQNFKSYAVATMDSVITPEMRKGAIRLKANMLQSCYLRNDGKGKFTMIPLPEAAQISQLSGMVVDDFDGDGNLDVALSGNDFGTEVSTGRYDAFNGLLLKGDGKGGFKPLTIQQSGIYIPGDGKALVKLRGAKGQYLLAASQYKAALKLFELKKPVSTVKLQPLDMFATIKYKNGKAEKREFYNGGSFLSQSARFFNTDKSMASVTVTDNTGHARSILLN